MEASLAMEVGSNSHSADQPMSCPEIGLETRSRRTKQSFYAREMKRILDIVLAGLALLPLAFIAVLVAVAIKIEDSGKVLFRQRRVGRNGELFTIYKFRTMPENTSQIPSRKAGTLTVTTVGRILRRTNLDEFPQLINILKGDMSLVGPRPPLPAQKELIELRKRNGAIACRPGLTGLAQVNGYDDMPVPEKAAWDRKYAESIRFRQDLLIILRTFQYLLAPPPRY